VEKLSRPDVKYEIGKSIKLSLSAGQSMTINDANGVLHISIQESSGLILRYNLVGTYIESMTISNGPDTPSILIGSKATTL
jgi:hypothetical protein